MSNILTNLLKETSPSRLLLVVSTDFLALRLFCFNMRQHGRQTLYFKLHVYGRKFHYRRPHPAVRPQFVHRCPRLFQFRWPFKKRACCVNLWRHVLGVCYHVLTVSQELKKISVE